MGNIIVTPDEKRGTFNRIAEVMSKQLGTTVEDFLSQYKIMPTVLRLAQYLNPGLSQYTLSPRKGVDPQIPTQILLDQNDFFAISGVGIRIGRANYAAGIYSNHGNFPIFTYPDPNFFTGVGTSAGKESDGLQCLVNGTFAISVNSDTVVDPVPNTELVFNPEATYTATPLAYPRFGGSDGERGLWPVTPQVILDASADNMFTVNLAPGAKLNIDGSISTGTTDSGLRNILYIAVQGWKIKNLGNVGKAVRCAV